MLTKKTRSLDEDKNQAIYKCIMCEFYLRWMIDDVCELALMDLVHHGWVKPLFQNTRDLALGPQTSWVELKCLFLLKSESFSQISQFDSRKCATKIESYLNWVFLKIYFFFPNLWMQTFKLLIRIIKGFWNVVCCVYGTFIRIRCPLQNEVCMQERILCFKRAYHTCCNNFKHIYETISFSLLIFEISFLNWIYNYPIL